MLTDGELSSCQYRIWRGFIDLAELRPCLAGLLLTVETAVLGARHPE